MITEIVAWIENEEDFENGCDLRFIKFIDDNNVTLKFEDDKGVRIFEEIEISLDTLNKVVEVLNASVDKETKNANQS